jgi:hypothetical protein
MHFALFFQRKGKALALKQITHSGELNYQLLAHNVFKYPAGMPGARTKFTWISLAA